MKKLFTLLALLTCFMGVKAQNWVEDYNKEFSSWTSFPFYVMGYVPEWVDGVMTDYGADYRYATQADLDGDGDGKLKDSESIVGSALAGATEYQKVTGAGPYWHQYFIADGIPTEIGGNYTVKAMVKASQAVTINVNMGWGWGEGQQAPASVAIGTDWAEVEWEYQDIGGSSCNLVAQPGTSTAVIEWKYIIVGHTAKQTRPTVWQEWLTSDGKPVIVETTPADIPTYMGNAETPWANPNVKFDDQENNYLICAWSKEKGRNMNEEQGWDPFPADIEEVDGSKVFVCHGQPATTEGDPSAWDNQFWIQSPRAWKAGEQVKIHFRYKASADVSSTDTQIHLQNPSNYLIWHAIGNIAFTTEWQEFDGTMTIQDDMAGGWSIAFNLNTVVKDAVTFYFDDLSWQSMVLDEGYFVAASNKTTGIEYDYDNAIEFTEDPSDPEVIVATVGTVGKSDTWVDELMISTVRGNDASFKGATIKPSGTITGNDPDNWQDFVAGSNAKIKLPAAGVWQISIAPADNQILFMMLEGAEAKPDDPIVTNTTAIVVNAVERDDLSDQVNQQTQEVTIRENEGGTGEAWDNQFWFKANRALEKGEVTVLKFKYKASREAKTSTQCHGETPGAYMHWAAIGDVTFTTEWQEFSTTFTVPNEADGMWCIAFNMAEIKEACDYEITDVQWFMQADCNEEGKTPENLINETGTANFFVKIGAGTDPYQYGGEGIFTITDNATTNTDAIYNLSGQRVGADYKGIVIKNGKKIVVK